MAQQDLLQQHKHLESKEQAAKDFPKLQAEAKADGWIFKNSYLPTGYSRTRADGH